MIAQGSGNIIHISSVGGLQAHWPGLPYDMTKGALDSMTQAMALDLAEYGIRVNAVSPGLVDTEVKGRKAIVLITDGVDNSSRLGVEHDRHQVGARDPVDHAMVGLRHQGPRVVLQPLDQPDLPQRPLAIECIVRGYLSGSGWKEYRHSQTVCGIPLPAGLTESAELPEPIFTPATKATPATIGPPITTRTWPPCWKVSTTGSA